MTLRWTQSQASAIALQCMGCTVIAHTTEQGMLCHVVYMTYTIYTANSNSYFLRLCILPKAAAIKQLTDNNNSEGSADMKPED